MIVNYGRFVLRFLLAMIVFWLATFWFLVGLWVVSLPVLLVGAYVVYRFKDSRSTKRYDAHFATPQELKPLVEEPMSGDGMLIGFAYNKPLAVRPGLAGKLEIGHFLFCGPNRAGKGLSITSNLNYWQGSAIITDVKGELSELTAGYRQDVLGQRVFILNASSGEMTHQFDPFAEMETDEQILSAATAYMNPNQDGDNAIFARRASAMLAAIIRAGKVMNKPIIPTIDAALFHPEGLKGAALSLHALGDRMITKWLNTFLGKDADKVDWEAAESARFLQNSWERLRTQAQPLTTQGVINMTGGRDFKASDLQDSNVTVYLVFRESELESTLPVFNLIVDALLKSMMRRYDLSPKLREGFNKTLAFFDEAYVAQPYNLPNYSATASGRGIYLAVYVQALSQLAKWGKEGQTTLMENLHTKVFLPPVDRKDSSPDGTAAFVADSCGEYMADDRNVGKDEHEHPLHSSVRLTPQPLITASQFALLPVGQSIVMTNNLPPILAHRLEPWRFEEFDIMKVYPMPDLPVRGDTVGQPVTLPAYPEPAPKPKATTPARVKAPRATARPTAQPAPAVQQTATTTEAEEAY